MRTFDNRPLYVPNALFTQIVVENPSRMTNWRIVETVGIRYDDAGQMVGVVADVKAMLEAHPKIDTDHTLIVNFNEFSPSSLDFLYTRTRTRTRPIGCGFTKSSRTSCGKLSRSLRSMVPSARSRSQRSISPGRMVPRHRCRRPDDGFSE